VSHSCGYKSDCIVEVFGTVVVHETGCIVAQHLHWIFAGVACAHVARGWEFDEGIGTLRKQSTVSHVALAMAEGCHLVLVSCCGLAFAAAGAGVAVKAQLRFDRNLSIQSCLTVEHACMMAQRCLQEVAISVQHLERSLVYAVADVYQLQACPSPCEELLKVVAAVDFSVRELGTQAELAEGGHPDHRLQNLSRKHPRPNQEPVLVVRQHMVAWELDGAHGRDSVSHLEYRRF
jgi:hypothetical protein